MPQLMNVLVSVSPLVQIPLLLLPLLRNFRIRVFIAKGLLPPSISFCDRHHYTVTLLHARVLSEERSPVASFFSYPNGTREKLGALSDSGEKSKRDYPH